MKSILTIMLFAILCMPVWGQSVVASAGQSASNNILSASATVGEAIIGSSSSAGTAANQGFQQPLQSDLSTSIYSPQGQLVDVTLSPNPVMDNVKISFSKEVDNIQVVIYTNTGALVKSYQYQGPRTVVQESLADLESGSYYIYIMDNLGRRLGSLSIVKI